MWLWAHIFVRTLLASDPDIALTLTPVRPGPVEWPSMDMSLKNPDQVSTATVVAAGLIGGWLTARESGIRPLGTIPLAAAGALAARSWNRKKGPGTAAALTATYIGAFGLSHPLAKKIGAWPAVLTATAGAAATAYLVSDRA